MVVQRFKTELYNKQLSQNAQGEKCANRIEVSDVGCAMNVNVCLCHEAQVTSYF